MSVSLTTCQGDTIEVHGKGCADIAKKTRLGKFYNGTDTIDFPDETDERAVWIDFNSDFLWEGGADNAWPMKFYPCTHAAGLKVNPDRTWSE